MGIRSESVLVLCLCMICADIRCFDRGGYDPKFRTGHYDGKGRIAEWILQQTKDNGKKMGAAIFTTGPYIQMTLGKSTPMSPVIEDGVVVWRVPLGQVSGSGVGWRGESCNC